MLGVEGEAAGVRRGVSTAEKRDRCGQYSHVYVCVCTPVLCVVRYMHVFFAYLVFSYKRPKLPTVSSPLCSVVKVTGFGDAPPHVGAVVFKLDITWRFEAGFIHLHYLPVVLHTHTHSLTSDLAYPPAAQKEGENIFVCIWQQEFDGEPPETVWQTCHNSMALWLWCHIYTYMPLNYNGSSILKQVKGLKCFIV